jgi:hypothetical protein
MIMLIVMVVPPEAYGLAPPAKAPGLSFLSECRVSPFIYLVVACAAFRFTSCSPLPALGCVHSGAEGEDERGDDLEQRGAAQAGGTSATATQSGR